jgi:putative ABC transport system permease protein
MIKQNLQLFIRRLLRNKTQFFITLSGMVLALTAIILAFTSINDEKQYDRFHNDTNNIFRVNKWNKESSGEKVKLAETPGLMSAQLVNDLPEIVSSTRIAPWFDDVLLSYNNKNIKTKKWVFADSNFFSFFNFQLLKGDPAQVLNGPGKMLVTPILAKAIFGDADPVGQVIKGIDDKLYTVSGIVAEAPRRSHIQFDVLVSYATTSGGENFLDFSFMNNWLGQTVYTFVRLQKPEQLTSVNKKLPAFTARYMSNRTDVYDFYLQPFSDIYLNSYDIRSLRGGKYGSAAFLQTFTLISLLILLIACFNYVNIVTAQSLQRAKEVGVKKILGAQRKQLILQFLFETVTLMIFASLLALIAAMLLLPQLNNWFQKDIPTYTIYQIPVLGILALTILITTLVSGLVPAFILSGFKPMSIFQKKFNLSPGGELSRGALVTIQLCIGIGLIGGALVLNRQFSYIMNKDLGFNKDQVINLKTPPGIRDKSVAFRQETESLTGVKSISICGAAMPEGTFTSTVIPEGNNGQEMVVREFRVDTSYMRTYGLQLAAGRFFGLTSDNNAGGLVINESFAKQMQWKEAIGKRIRFASDTAMYPVIGVLKDFNFSSLHETIMPVVMYLNRRTGNISIQFEAAQVSGLLPKLETVWKKFEQRYPFEYEFLDQNFAANYGKEKQLVTAILVFTIIAITIACLGLYGLAAFAISRRTKEIGVRKVLGAPVSGIVMLLVKNFLKPVVLAFVIATPIVWYLINQWLQNFAFHIKIGWWLLAIPGVSMLLIVFATISFQTIRAAFANPIKSLRTE